MKRMLIAATVIGASLAFAASASAASHAKKADGDAMKKDAMAKETMAKDAMAKDKMAMPAGDVAKGKKIFRKCKACHAVGKTAKNKVGPVLNGVVGRKAGEFKGYKYSKALKSAAEKGLTWDAASLDKFLIKPKKFLPKTKMSFAGLKKAGQRADLIAYLATFK